MKTGYAFIIVIALLLGVFSAQVTYLQQTAMQEKTFNVKIDNPENGSIKLDPTIPADGEVSAGRNIRAMKRNSTKRGPEIKEFSDKTLQRSSVVKFKRPAGMGGY